MPDEGPPLLPFRTGSPVPEAREGVGAGGRRGRRRPRGLGPAGAQGRGAGRPSPRPSRAAGWASATVSVRVNGASTPWFADDLRAVAGAGERLDAVILPKVETADDLRRTAALLAEAGAAAGRERPIGLQALIESARGLRDVNEIAEADPSLEALILGPADMSVSLGFPSPEEGSRWDFVRGAVLVAARAAGIQAIDGPFLQIADLPGLRASGARARELGFDGKWALHPDQIEPLNELFSPTPDEVARARSILDALADS